MAINIVLLNSIALGTGGSGEIQLKGNQGFFLQLVWTGNDGNFTVKIQGSNDETSWTDAYMNNGGTLESETTLSGAADNHAIEFDSFFAPFMKVVITSGTATAGTLDGSISVVDNQDTF